MNDNLKKWLPWIAVAAVALIVIVIIAVNSGGDDEAADTTTTSSTEAGETTTTSEATEETTTTSEAGSEKPEPGPLGAIEVAAGEDIQIRTVQAITGDVAFLGVPNQRGVEIAINDFGPIKGHNVSIGTPLDDLCSAEGGQAAGQTVAADEQVVGSIATSCSGAAVAMAPLVAEAGQVMISPSNTSPALTSDLQGTAGDNYNAGYYRTAHNDLFQGAAVADFVYNELGLTKAAAIHDGDPYTNGLAAAFQAAFEELGGEVVAFTAVNKGDTDMVPVLTEVAAAEPEVLFYPIFMPEGGFIAQQSKTVAGFENITMIAADGLLTDNFMELKESEGTYFSGPNLDYGNNTSETGQNAEGFLAAYDTEYGEAPSAAFWAHSYDAAVLLMSAIDSVAVELSDGSLFIDRQALRDALTATSNFGGIIGTLSCDEFGDCGAQRISVVHHLDSEDINAGKTNIVYEFTP
ncbi:MAG: branched-chain amino acid ABC transporter substrate-binding protein [Acidimicrobiia bacterium]